MSNWRKAARQKLFALDNGPLAATAKKTGGIFRGNVAVNRRFHGDKPRGEPDTLVKIRDELSIHWPTKTPPQTMPFENRG